MTEILTAVAVALTAALLELLALRVAGFLHGTVRATDA
jgi:hypothetical protein